MNEEIRPLWEKFQKSKKVSGRSSKLKTLEDEVKIVLETSLFVGGPGGSAFYYPDGTNVYDVSRRKRFGLFLANPPDPEHATRTIELLRK